MEMMALKKYNTVKTANFYFVNRQSTPSTRLPRLPRRAGSEAFRRRPEASLLDTVKLTVNHVWQRKGW